MAADLHIHLMTPEITESDLRKAMDRIAETPSVWVGQVSWLKAVLTGNDHEFIPGVIDRIAALIPSDRAVVVDDDLIEAVAAAFTLPNQSKYAVADAEDVLAFLREHCGERVFSVSW